MPKEFVDTALIDSTSVSGTVEHPGHPVSRVEIRWGANQHGYVTAAVLTLVSPEGEEPVYEAGTYVNLSRAGIDRMIGKLAKARDDAFGKGA